MALTRINTNISAINSTRNLGNAGGMLSKSLERLSSGLRINRAADDAAGLSISERQRSQIRGLNRAVKNAQDAISLVNTAEGALNETTNRLQRIRELAVQAANSGGMDSDAIQAAQDEIETSIQEITRIGQTTQFSTRVLLNGDNENNITVREGTPDHGVSVSNTVVNSSIPSGTSFLRIDQTQVGTETITVGSDGGNFGLVGGVDAAGAITDNTFETGDYEITVNNVTDEQQQVLETATFSGAANWAAALDATTFQGVSLDTGDVLHVRGMLNDGTIVTHDFTLGVGDTIQDFVNDIVAFVFPAGEASLFSYNDAAGNAGIEVTSAQTGTSDLALSIMVDDISQSGGAADGIYDGVDEAEITQLGQENSAILTIDGGTAVRASAGETVTLYGREPATPSTTEYQRQVTLNFTSADAFVREGTETLNVTQAIYEGTLNGGREVEFSPGQREVLFRTGTGAGHSSGDFLLLDFDTEIDLGGTTGTVIFSSVNHSLNFQIGANEGQNMQVALSSMESQDLGFTGGLDVDGAVFDGTISDLDVRTITGAENAIRIVDRAMAQVSRQRSYLGATTNRLEATIANLGVASENLTAAESRIRDADVAYETTQFTRNQILVQAGTSILAQANLAPQSVLQLLG